MTRDLNREIDLLKQQMADLQQMMQQFVLERGPASAPSRPGLTQVEVERTEQDPGQVFYSGHVYLNEQAFRWEPQERRMEQLLGLNSDKAAKVLTALANKQRLDILRTVLNEPFTGAELVHRLNMGTTGQLYHHLKALMGADLLVQEPGGRYTFPNHRCLPFLLLLAAVNDLLDTSDYLDMMETRNNAGIYFGAAQDYDVNQLLWAVVENSILEHQSGFCHEIGIFLHDDGSVTVSDDGRGIMVGPLPNTGLPAVQSFLTDINRLNGSTRYQVPGAEQGISIAVVNALSQRLTVEVRQDGKVYRQEYSHGIPQSGLMTVGITKETGTSITLKPEAELFGTGFDRNRLEEHKNGLQLAYPNLSIRIHE
ncbi:MAG: helix-turn-helix domain-containing protein [Paenibacillus sp.]|nr:helix-turn-helix domain-containing protein [Paenibacillus sp.]